MRRFFTVSTAILLAMFNALAAEHHGEVKFGGLPIPGATVTATSGEKKFSTLTDGKGAYSFPDLPEGTWTVQVEMLCFAPQQHEVKTGEPATWELTMIPLEEIKAAAGPQTTPPARTSVTTSLNTQTQTATPEPATPQPATPAPAAQKGFKKTDLTASKTPPPPTQDPGPQADAAQSADAFAINGSVNNGAASPFGQSAAFGNFRKNGNGLYHGSLGMTLDNSVLDAQSYSLTGQATNKPAYNRLQASGSIGGPVRIPHLIRDDKTQFFFLYQIIRNRNANTLAGLVPTLAERSGDLSQSGPAIDPTTGAPFPGNIIPANRISTQAAKLLSFYPLPNFPSTGRYNYQVPLTSSTHQDAVQARVNRSFGNKDQTYATFAWQGNSTRNTNFFAFADDGASTGWNTVLSWQHRFNQRLFGHVQYNFSRLTSESIPYFDGKRNVSAEAGITGNNQDPLNWGPPTLVFASGIAPLTDGKQSLDRNQTHALGYDMFWNRRSHNITFGADYKRLQLNALSQQDPRGTFTFTGATTGNSFASFLLGIPDTSSIAYGNADKYFRQNIYDAYFTDDWRIGPSLSVNAGGRWEYSSPINEKYGRLVNLAIGPGFSTATPLVDAHLRPDRAGFEPRIGLSWRPIPGSSTVVRAGYGLYQNTSVYQTIALQMAQQFPLSTSLSIQNTPANPLTLANGFVSNTINGRSTFGIDPDFRVGYAHNWQVSVQRDLPGSLVGIATYLGIKGTRAVQQFLPNTYPNGAANPCPLCPTGFTYMTSNGNSTREALQLQLRRRLRSGITASLQYTWSKSIDDAALGGRSQGTAVIAQNWLNLAGERGLSTFDQRHLIAATAQYSSGMGVRGGALMTGWRGKLLKEWTVTTQINAGTGLPETPIYIAAVQGTGVTGSIRPDYTGANLYSPPGGLFLNPAAYTAPLPGHWGNAGRDSITGPNQFTLNASLGRTFRLTDRFSADFRFDSTNALNHVNFGSFNTNVTSSQFGLPTNPGNMRNMQANLRVRF